MGEYKNAKIINDLDLDNNKITNLGSPSAATDAATKGYVDSAAGGIGGLFQATVGATGADYTTVSAAVTAGHTRILMLNDATEVGDTNIGTSDILLYIPHEVNWTMASHSIVFNTSLTRFTVEGNGDIIATPGLLDPSFKSVSGSGQELHLNGVNILSGATVANAHFASIDVVELKDMYVRPANFDNTGFDVAELNCRNVRFFGTGAACQNVFKCDTGTLVDIEIVGTFLASGVCATIDSSNVNINGMYYASPSTTVFNAAGNITNLRVNLGIMHVETGQDDTAMTNCFLGSGELTIGDLRDQHFTNVNTAGRIIWNAGVSPQDCYISNCAFTGPVNTLLRDRTHISNSFFGSGLTVDADSCIVMGCRVGDGGTANTITVAATATNCIISSNLTDNDITNDSTTTTEIGNVTF